MFNCLWWVKRERLAGFVVKMFLDSGVQVSSRCRPALEKVVQKIGSASDVGLAGFGGPALMWWALDLGLYWSMTW